MPNRARTDSAQARFKLQNSPILFEKMLFVARQAMSRYSDEYHLEVRQSAEAFIVPGALDVGHECNSGAYEWTYSQHGRGADCAVSVSYAYLCVPRRRGVS